MAETLDRFKAALNRAAVRAQHRASEPPRTREEELTGWARAHLAGRKLVVVSNREPYSHERQDGKVRLVRNAGGLTVALDAVMRALGGVWVAHGGGSADRETVDSHDHLACPPDRPRYTLRRIWLSREDHARYYAGFANSGLWPLCHIVYVRPSFRIEEWERYREVNQRFAQAVLDEVGDSRALVFIQDYHLALAARTIRQQRPDIEMVMFWHIPWPNSEVFRIMPWRHELLDGMLANDVVAFHIRQHALNFLDTIGTTLEARVDLGHMAVERGGRRTWIAHSPISSDADGIAQLADSPEARRDEVDLRRSLGLEDCMVGLGVDRIDYTKGIPERLEAVERFLEKYPQWQGRFCFIQIGVPSRIELKEYRNVQARTRRWVDRINNRFPRPGGPTVHLVVDNLDFRSLVPYYRMADLCAVTALHDGMNLVAKEYVSSCTDLDGSLVLSPFTGAARELERAWLASPYDVESLADTLHAALSEPVEARQARMAALRETVQRHNIFDWTREVLDSVLSAGLRTPPAEEAPAALAEPAAVTEPPGTEGR